MRTSTDQARRVLIASLVGSTVEWYEFFIYGTAASLLFDELFFPDFDPLVSALLALSTFAIAFVARPIGGAVFGHFGDRIGRKSMLVITLTMMGAATFAIGLLPTYAQIGVAAPLLLVLLRLVQGFSLGGEYGGAVLMSIEHAGTNKRGFFGAVVNTGAGWGLLLANLVFLAVSQLPDEAFRTWGWRVPFLLSAVLVVLGLVIRLKLDESPDFQAVKQSGEVRKAPVVEVLRRHGGLVALVCLAYLSAGVTFYVGTVFSLSYGTGRGTGRSTLLGLVTAVNVLTILAIPFFGWLSDRYDRKRIFLAGIVGMAALCWVWFPLLGAGSTALMLLGFVILFIPYAANYGVMPAFFAHVFPAPVRYTGLSIGYTLGTVLGSGLAPIIATFLLGTTGGWPAIAFYMSGVGVLSFVAALFLHERHGEPAVAGKAGIAPAGTSS
ncbi:MFS transporter [Pseudonocardia kunmingensis]|uniref:Putative proline/betaine transporter n=1 Tax=Pseudonocardia kunmingensis TaxID=630975 RepID=A0A543DIG5_9PSEU|nr:MFS transporter [Pseudonocardia kunmingensis]TQM09055.1 metabolite-proton symporter [Pseudonocardia kunmingensis]